MAGELDDGGSPALDVEFLREAWSRVGFDLATDAWATVDGSGAIVGYGQAMLESPGVVESWGTVHPEHRGRGVGSSLLDRVEQRASELSAEHPDGRFRHAIYASDRGAAAMLEARGLRPVRHFWHMQRRTTSRADGGTAPVGAGRRLPRGRKAALATLVVGLRWPGPSRPR